MEESVFFHVHHNPRNLLVFFTPVIPVGGMMLSNIQFGLID